MAYTFIRLMPGHNITMSQWSVWHSITTRGCDRTSPFYYPLSGQSLILPLCSWGMLFTSLVCALGFYISGSPCQDPYPPGPQHLAITMSLVLKATELLCLFFSPEITNPFPSFVVSFPCLANTLESSILLSYIYYATMNYFSFTFHTHVWRNTGECSTASVMFSDPFFVVWLVKRNFCYQTFIN